MRKDHKEEITQTITICDEIICNQCGKSFKPRYMGLEHYKNSQIHTFKGKFEYGSLYDGEDFEIDLCEKCLIDLIIFKNTT